MNKNKRNVLFIASLAAIFVLSFSVALAKAENGTGTSGAKHRSNISAFVETLLNVAERQQNGIGEEVRVIAQEQNNAKDKVANAIDKVDKRGKVKTFLLGTDYKNIGQLRSEMVQARNRIEQLNRVTERTENEADKTELQIQIQNMEQEQQKIENFIASNENKFSLFGWFVKVFNE